MSTSLYRGAIIGEALIEALQELTDERVITTELAMRVVEEYDRSIVQCLETQVHAKAHVKAGLSTYRHFDSLWQFRLKDGKFKVGTSGSSSLANVPEISVNKITLICVDKAVMSAQDEAAAAGSNP